MATVLLADDDEALIQMYQLWIEESSSSSLSTRTAADGEAALSTMDDQVDVALLDRGMPRRTGDEVARSIRASHPDCSIVIASAFEPDHIDEGVYDHYLVKPVSRDQLVPLLERAVGEAAPVNG